MARAIWSGSLLFGLVSVPVRMDSALDETDLHFHLLHRKDDSRIGYEKVCKKEGQVVPDDEIGTAYEISKGKYVYLEDEDFEAAEPKGTEPSTFPTSSHLTRSIPSTWTEPTTLALPNQARRSTPFLSVRWKHLAWLRSEPM